MPHAKFGPDLLKTVAVHKEQRNRLTFSFVYIRWAGIVNIIGARYVNLPNFVGIREAKGKRGKERRGGVGESLVHSTTCDFAISSSKIQF